MAMATHLIDQIKCLPSTRDCGIRYDEHTDGSICITGITDIDHNELNTVAKQASKLITYTIVDNTLSISLSPEPLTISAIPDAPNAEPETIASFFNSKHYAVSGASGNRLSRCLHIRAGVFNGMRVSKLCEQPAVLRVILSADGIRILTILPSTSIRSLAYQRTNKKHRFSGDHPVRPRKVWREIAQRVGL